MKIVNSCITLSFLDITLIKWSSVLFGMILGSLVHEYVKNNIWLFIFLVVLFALKPAYAYLTKKNKAQD